LRPFLLLCALALSACDAQPSRAPEGGAKQESPPRLEVAGRLDRSHAGSPAPEIVFEDPSGEEVSLADFRGKPVLLNLWATWCAPCVAEMPTLNALAASRPDIQVLALSQDIDGRQKVDAFLKEHKLPSLEAYLDPQLAVMGALKVQSLPTTILYDASGREVWRMTGAEEWNGPRAAALLAEASREAAR
jgi:thiol-disulfide isomerase/thioredoxin